MVMDGEIKILGVDDRPENLFALEAVLEPLEVSFIKANSGMEAINLLSDYEFALILMDVQMPQMDGFTTAELIRENDTWQTIPIIFVTAISKDSQHVFQGYEAGAVDYLFKPLDIHILRSKVTIFIELFKQKRELLQRNQALEAANKQIISQQEALLKKERQDMLFQVTGATADQLNSPLMALMGNIDLIRMDLPETHKREIYLDRIYASAQKIAVIVEKIRMLQQHVHCDPNERLTLQGIDALFDKI